MLQRSRKTSPAPRTRAGVHRLRCVAVLLALPVAVAAAVGTAEVPDLAESPDLAEVPDLATRAEVAPGRRVRASLRDGDTVEGTVIRWDVDALELRDWRAGSAASAGRPMRLSIDDVDGIWARTTAARSAGRTLGVAGAIGLGGYATLVALYCSGIADESGCWVLVPLGIGVGYLGGRAVGWVFGGVAERWERVYPDDAPADAPPSLRGDRPLGTLHVQMGAAASADPRAPDGGGGGRLAILRPLRPHVDVGVEVGWWRPGRTESVFSLSGLGRVSPLPGPTEPYVQLGIGYVGWTSVYADYVDFPYEVPPGQRTRDDFLAYGVAAGVSRRVGERTAVTLELRYDDNLQRLVPVRRYDLWSLTIGIQSR